MAPDWCALGISLGFGILLLVMANLLFKRARSHLEDFL
jgi:hypothetical protein